MSKRNFHLQTIEEALTALGAAPSLLSDEEKASLDGQGYAIFPRLMSEEQVEHLRNVYERLMREEGPSAGREVHQEAGTRRLADLVNKDEGFDIMYTHPKVLAAVYHVLGRDFKLSSLNGRDALPGEGHQALHADWGARRSGEPYHVVNSLWLLDDFTGYNGSTRIVAGTHKREGKPADFMADPAAAHPEEIILVAPAGSVVVFNAHTWHGGTVNRTKEARRVCHGYFCAREHEQQLNQRKYIRKATYDRISPAARYILDVD
jgi:ectoine hydroxylase-related dioxygenase (phytanoyl-CoA dioxygenase family)